MGKLGDKIRTVRKKVKKWMKDNPDKLKDPS